MADSGIVLVIKIGENVKWEFDEVVVAVEKSEFDKKVKAKSFE